MVADPNLQTNGKAQAGNRLLDLGITANAVTLSLLQSTLGRRAMLEGKGGKQYDIDGECGYPSEIGPDDYRKMYDREGIASRVVGVLPEESWALDPEVYETEEITETPFEKSWNKLVKRLNVWHYLHRVDRLSGIGRFGVLLLGLNDDRPLDEPVVDLDSAGMMPKDPAPVGKLKLLYLRVFDESLVSVATWNTNKNSPRFGQPDMYQVKLINLEDGQQPVGGTPSEDGSPPTTDSLVHWTRVIHVADNRDTSEVYGVPRMQRVFNRLIDIRKIMGGSGEMFWKGGFPGLSFEMMPGLAEMGVKLDEQKLKDAIEAYTEGINRYLALVGVSAKSLAPNVADPSPNIEAIVQFICITLGIPHRVFMGSEQAKLAASQDKRTWNDRLGKRQGEYISPLVVRPFVDRCILFGIVPPPAPPKEPVEAEDGASPLADKAKMAPPPVVVAPPGGRGAPKPITNLALTTPLPPVGADLGLDDEDDEPDWNYQVFWPDLNTSTDQEKADTALKRTQALAAYVGGGVDTLVPELEFLTEFIGLEQDVAQAIIAAATDRIAKIAAEEPVPGREPVTAGELEIREREGTAAELEAKRVAAEIKQIGKPKPPTRNAYDGGVLVNGELVL